MAEHDEVYRAVVTLRNNSTGQEVEKKSRPYRDQATAKGQGTRIARDWRHGFKWVKTEIQEASWTTIQTLT